MLEQFLEHDVCVFFGFMSKKVCATLEIHFVSYSLVLRRLGTKAGGQ